MYEYINGDRIVHSTLESGKDLIIKARFPALLRVRSLACHENKVSRIVIANKVKQSLCMCADLD